MASRYAKMTLEQLAGCGGQPGSVEGIAVANQFALRSTRAQIWAARWMAASVAVIALASVADLWLTHFANSN